MTTEMTISDLRAAITAALKRRDPEAGLWQAISNDRRATWAATVRRVELVVSAHGPAADLDALRALAAACGLREDGSDPASDVERLAAERALVDAEWRRDMADMRAQMERARHEAAKDYDASRAARDNAAQAFDDLVVRVWRAATGDTHEGPASVDVLVATVSDLRAQLREVRRAVIASVRGEEHAVALTDAALDEYAASTGEDVACLVARMQTAEADVERLTRSLAKVTAERDAFEVKADEASEAWSALGGSEEDDARGVDLQSLAHAVKARWDAAERDLIQTNFERDTARDDLAQLAEQQRRLMATIGEQAAEIVRLRADNSRLDDVAKGALDDLARVRAELSALATRFEQLRVSRYALEGQCRELHRALARRKARIARQRADAERFRKERNEARAALRDVAARCDRCNRTATPQPTGVHLVALDASRIVLAVEAIGDDRG